MPRRRRRRCRAGGRRGWRPSRRRRRRRRRSRRRRRARGTRTPTSRGAAASGRTSCPLSPHRRAGGRAPEQHRPRAADAAAVSSCHSKPPLSYRASPSTRVAGPGPERRRRRRPPPDPPMVDTASRKGRRSARSARLPGTSEPISSSRPSARAPPSVASSSASVAVSAPAASLARARRRDHRAQLLEVVVRRGRARRRRCRRRRGARPRGAPRAARSRSRAARSSAGSARRRRRAAGEQRDLLGVDLDAVRGDDALVEEARLREACGSRSGRAARRACRRTGATALRRAAASRARPRSRSGASPPAGRAPSEAA